MIFGMSKLDLDLKALTVPAPSIAMSVYGRSTRRSILIIIIRALKLQYLLGARLLFPQTLMLRELARIASNGPPLGDAKLGINALIPTLVQRRRLLHNPEAQPHRTRREEMMRKPKEKRPKQG